jgi:glycerophosphoryl diester phosphodiesterase
VPPIGFAHRGARAEQPENTIAAFTRALQLGATGLESDAWLTADGVVVLDHDGVTGPLWRRRAISAQPRSALPAHIPALKELYERCGGDFELSLDVKDPAALEAIVAVAAEAGALSRLWLCHHDWRLMAAWPRVTGQAKLVESTRLSWVPEGLAARSTILRDNGIHAVNLHRSEWDSSKVAEVHDAGLSALAWDAQNEKDIEALIALGVDGIFSDHVGRLMSAIGAAA